MVFNGFKLWQFAKQLPIYIYSLMIYQRWCSGPTKWMVYCWGYRPSFFNNTWGKERGHSGHSTCITLWQTYNYWESPFFIGKFIMLRSRLKTYRAHIPLIIYIYIFFFQSTYWTLTWNPLLCVYFFRKMLVFGRVNLNLPWVSIYSRGTQWTGML